MTTETPKPTWLNRWQRYPRSIIGHIAWGSLSGLSLSAGVLVAAGAGPPAEAFRALAIAITLFGFALIWFIGGIAYQFGSGFRKHDTEGRTDTVGLDCVDYAVGTALGFTACVPTLTGLLSSALTTGG